MFLFIQLINVVPSRPNQVELKLQLDEKTNSGFFGENTPLRMGIPVMTELRIGISS